MARAGLFIHPTEIRRKAGRYWDNQRFLQAYMRDEPLFPLAIPFPKPTSRQLLEQFTAVREALRLLREGSKEQLGYGYALAYQQIQHRQLGQQALPARVIFETAEDFLRFIGKLSDFRRFNRLQEEILTGLPALQSWLVENPLKALDHQAVWPELLQICRYFLANPRPHRYIRELDIAGVDGKFIERHRGLLRELLDELLLPAAIEANETSLSGHGFERRYGLKYDEPLIRFRILDKRLCGGWGLTDISVPQQQFCTLAIPCKRVFVLENKITGLSFPAFEGAIAIFGLGYGVVALQEAGWLRDKPMGYWGDIDTHGFAILSQLRGYFPQVRSLLMDRQTLLDFKPFWGKEATSKRFTGELVNLNAAERKLFIDIRDNRLGDNLRLEQERINYSYALGKLSTLSG